MGMTETATRLIKRFGQDATLTKTTEEPTDPWGGGGTVTVDHTVTVAVTEYTVEERANSFIADTDLRVFVTAGVEPVKGDDLTIGSVQYRVERVGILAPDGVVICYELRVSR